MFWCLLWFPNHINCLITSCACVLVCVLLMIAVDSIEKIVRLLLGEL